MQQGVPLHLQVQPIGAITVDGDAFARVVDGNLGAGNHTQRFFLPHQAVQTCNVGAVVRFRIRNINEQAAAALRNVSHVLFGLNHIVFFCKQDAVLVHEWKRQGRADTDRVNADGDEVHKSGRDYAFSHRLEVPDT